MSSKKVINKTTYTKQFYRKITIYKIGNSLSLTVVFVGAILFCYGGIKQFIDGTSTMDGWISLIKGLVLLPLIGLGLPYLFRMLGYSLLKKKNGGEDYSISVEFTSQTLRIKPSFGDVISVPYDKLKNYEEKKNLIVVTPTNAEIFYLDRNGFIDCGICDARKIVQNGKKK